MPKEYKYSWDDQESSTDNDEDMFSVEDHVPHGISGYTHYRCRCDICRTAGNAYHNKLQKNNRKAAKETKAKVRSKET